MQSNKKDILFLVAILIGFIAIANSFFLAPRIFNGIPDGMYWLHLLIFQLSYFVFNDHVFIEKFI
jgi:hypothetical protein